jgi:hypothetical protein
LLKGDAGRFGGFIEALLADGPETVWWCGAAFGGDEAKSLGLSDPAVEAAGVGWKIRSHKRLI